jgi:excisionase family DNA binding protein
MIEKLLKLPAVAEILDTSYETILALIKAGLLPVVRVGRRGLRVDPTMLRDWVEGGGAKGSRSAQCRRNSEGCYRE